MAYDQPLLGVSGQEVTLTYEGLITENIVEFAQDHRLRDGSLRHYHRGDKSHWKINIPLMNSSQRDELYNVYKSHQELHWQPRPDSEPTVHHKVRWIGGFSIHWFRGFSIIGYEGIIDLDQV